MTKPSEVSLSSTTSWLTSAGSITRTACGSSTRRSTCPRRSPSAMAASLWPLGSDRMPARTISAMTAPL